MDNNLQFFLDLNLRIDQAEKRIKDIFETLKQEAKQAIPVKVELEADDKKSVAAMQRLQTQLEQATAKVKELEKALGDLGKSRGKKGKVLDITKARADLKQYELDYERMAERIMYLEDKIHKNNSRSPARRKDLSAQEAELERLMVQQRDLANLMGSVDEAIKKQGQTQEVTTKKGKKSTQEKIDLEKKLLEAKEAVAAVEHKIEVQRQRAAARRPKVPASAIPAAVERASRDTTVNLGVHEDFFYQSLLAAIRYSEKKGLVVKVKAQAEGVAVTTVGGGAAKRQRGAGGRFVKSGTTTQTVPQYSGMVVNLARNAQSKFEADAARAEALANPLGALGKYGNARLQDMAGQLQKGITDPALAKTLADTVRLEFQKEISNSLKTLNPQEIRNLRAVIDGVSRKILQPFDTTVNKGHLSDIGNQRNASLQAARISQLIASYKSGHLDPFTKSIGNYGLYQQAGFDPSKQMHQQAEFLRKREDVVRRVRDWEREIYMWEQKTTIEEKEKAAVRVKNAQQRLESSHQQLRAIALQGMTGMGPMFDASFRLNPATGKEQPFIQLMRDSAGNPLQKSGDLSIIERLGHAYMKQELGGAFGAYQGNDPSRNFSQFLDDLHKSGGPTKEIEAIFAKMGMDLNGILRDTKAIYDINKQAVGVITQQERAVAATNRLEEQRAFRQRRSTEMGRMMRSASYLVGGGAVGLAAGFELRDSFNTSIQLQQEMRAIQGVLKSRSPGETATLKGGIENVARKYATDLLETAQAAKILAQTGMSANEVLKELDATMMATKGMQISSEAMQDLQIAIRAITGEGGHTLDVLEKISLVEAQYAVTAQDLTDSLRIVSPVLQQFTKDIAGMGDVFDYTIGMTTVLAERLRMTGTQAGNSLKFIFSRLFRPEIQKKLQTDFGVRLGQPGGNELLALPDMMQELSRVYMGMKNGSIAGGGNRANQLAVLLSGGRQVNAMIELLEQTSKEMEIAGKSSYAFSNAQQRAALQVDTLGSSLSKLRTNFRLLVDDFMDKGGIGGGIKAMVDLLSSLMGGVSAGGGGGVLSQLALIGVGGAATGVVKGTYGGIANRLAYNRVNNVDPTLFASYGAFRSTGQSAIMKGRMGAGAAMTAAETTALTAGAVGTGGFLSTLLGPGVLTLIVTTVLLAGAGKLYDMVKDKMAEEDRYKVALPDAARLRVFSSPQYRQFSSDAKGWGMGNASNAFDASISALQSGTHVQALLKSYGVSSFGELLSIAEKNKSLWEGIRILIGEAFVKDLGQGNLGRIEDQMARVGAASKLIAETAFAANAQLGELVEKVHDSATATAEEMSKGLNALDSSKRTTVWARMIANIGEFFSGRMDFDEKVKDIGNGRGGIAYTASDQVRRQLRSSMGDFSYRGFFGGSGGDTLEAVINRMKNSGATMGDMLDKWAKMFEESTEKVASITEWVTDEKTHAPTLTTRMGTRQDLLIHEMAASMLQRTGYQDLARGIAPNIFSGEGNDRMPGATPGTVFLEDLAVWSAKAADLAKDQAELFLRDKDKVAQFSSVVDELVNSGNAAAKSYLKTHEINEGLVKFKDNLLELILSIYQDFEKVRNRQAVAAMLGKPYDIHAETAQTAESALGSVLDFQSSQLADIVRLQHQYDNLTAQANLEKGMMAQFGPSGVTADKLAEAGVDLGGLDPASIGHAQEMLDKLATEINGAKQGLREFLSQGDIFAALFPNGSEEQKQIVATFQAMRAAFNQTGTFNVEALKGLLADIAKFNENMHQKNLDQISDLETQLSFEQRLIESRQAYADVSLTVTDRLQKQAQIIKDVAALEIAGMKEKARIDPTSYGPQVDRDVRAREAKMQADLVLNALNEFNASGAQLVQQTGQNMTQALSGITGAFSNLDVWKPILDHSKDAGKHLAANMLAPISETFNERIVSNLGDQLVKKMQGSELLSSLFGGPELGIKQAHEQGGLAVAQAIIQAHAAGAAMIAMASGNPVPGIPGDVAGGASGGVAAPGALQKGAIKGQIGAFIGNLGGTIAGGGGKGAQIGSALGTIGGSFLGPVGSAAFGIAGGIIGGMFDHDEEKQRQTIQQLEAIERAQKETITTIQAQTNALVNPQSLFLNLPSSLTVPKYNAGVGGTAGDTSHYFDFRGANFSGSDPKAVADAVEQRILDNLGGSRRRSARSVSNQ